MDSEYRHRKEKMALEKQIIEDKIEIVGEHRAVQVRTATIIKEDDVELSKSFSRHVLECVITTKNDDDTWTHIDTDISGESAEVQAVCNAVWTDAVKESKKTANEY